MRSKVFSLETFDIGSTARMAPAATATHRRTTTRPARATSLRFSITSIDLIRQRFLPSPATVSCESRAETLNEPHVLRIVPKTGKIRRLCDLPVGGLNALAEWLDRQFARKLVELHK